MGVFTKLGVQIAAPVDENGMPRGISPQEFQVWMTEVERLLSLFVTSGGLIYSSKADLDNDLAPGANSMAWVIGDPIAANNGVYGKEGPSGAGSWTRRSDLPFSYIIASDAGQGSPNAIQATTVIPVSSSALIWMNVAHTNTGSPVTVSFNGGPPLAIKTNSGSDVAPGGLLEGSVVLGVISGSSFRLLSDQSSAAIIAQAQAYATAAAGATNAGFVFNTEADFAAANIPPVLTFVRTAGYFTAGDGGGHTKIRIPEPSTVRPWHSQSADGAWWQVVEAVLNPLMFGAMRGRTNASSALAGIQAAVEYCEVFGGRVDLLGGTWFINDTFTISKPLDFVGRGPGFWWIDPVAAGNGLNDVAPTQIVLTGTGPRKHTFLGISSMKACGGRIANPSARAGFNEANYQLISLMNGVDDAAAPRSRRPISIGLYVKAEARGLSLDGFRMFPDGGGEDGLAIYNDAAATAATPWAADWDVGILMESAGAIVSNRVYAVGHFRMAGLLDLAIPAAPVAGAPPIPFEQTWSDCHFEGYRAVAIRGADQFQITGIGSNYVEVDWADDHPFDPLVNPVIGLSTGSFTMRGFTFSGMTKSGSTLRLTGLTSDPIAAGFNVGDIVVSRNVGGGTSHITFDNCTVSGMKHPAGYVCHDQRLGGNAMPYPGTIIEISGFRATEVYFAPSCRLQTREQVAWQIHDLHRSEWAGYLEASADVDGSKLMRFISSPSIGTNTRVPHPAGRTFTFIFSADENIINDATSGFDLRPYGSNYSTGFSAAGDNGLFEADTLIFPTRVLKTAVNGNVGMASPPGKYVGFFDRADGLIFGYDDANDRLEMRRHLWPNADNSRDLGDSSRRYRSVYALQYRFGGGTQFLTAGLGSPEGSISAPIGSLYLNLSGGAATTLYVKTSGTGNTGWTAK